MKTIKTESILDFQRKEKLTTKDTKLLIEAFRRKHFLNSFNGFMGLGTPTEYRSDYFTPYSKEIPRVLNWYKLTDRGEEIMIKMEKYFVIPTTQRTKNKINSILFEL